jgi:hypothetical protein
VCVARRFRLPIAIGDSVVRGIDRVDPQINETPRLVGDSSILRSNDFEPSNA